ncbi:unnamed protein product [Dovyalis caffra]|uniref:Uncharacterized protein n=1 Tax=Dovyalis caffra TaxID=77055 RepID=A0AAV1QZX0_9ROSI|nr:unnamed protein product [Dovyalis caffra]
MGNRKSSVGIPALTFNLCRDASFLNQNIGNETDCKTSIARLRTSSMPVLPVRSKSAVFNHEIITVEFGEMGSRVLLLKIYGQNFVACNFCYKLATTLNQVMLAEFYFVLGQIMPNSDLRHRQLSQFAVIAE